ncbi:MULTISPECIES: hypothetical protein [unclassified Bacillus (in: firmicutes)]|uniref:hypothetical protein n=1 Tax=unclassified Bacillus (in: firmicutes) TaxID=185979 RepID=UPI000BF57B40|nr:MULTISPECIES: hypothetical protein [unclassified Bacillus (in: firmicutes)]PEU18125.1 hypothetical protein CN525_12975 [Bacillus sp. AFS014408]PFW62394.1 hypothetical protein COL20_13185 [Bacillus sp. AFS075034]
MTVKQIDWHWFSGQGNGYVTKDINLAPSLVGATVSLNGHTGGGTSYTGIKQYRTGSGEVKTFGEWPNWPPCIFDTISSVTFATATGSEQIANAIARMDYWQ